MRFSTDRPGRSPSAAVVAFPTALALALVVAGCGLTSSDSLPGLLDIDEVQAAKAPMDVGVLGIEEPRIHDQPSVATEDPEIIQAWARESRRQAGRPPTSASGASEPFTCRLSGGRLTWDDVATDRYYVFFTIDGFESYLGPIADVEIIATRADSYRVEHWETGSLTDAVCPGEGVPALTCSHDDGVLSWPETGAERYYVFTIEDGVEQHLGPVEDTELEVDEADSYRVEHWMTGRPTDTTCSR